SRFRKIVFIAVWRTVMASAALVVAIDHRKAIVDLGIGLKPIIERWRAFSRLSETLVVSDSNTACLQARNPGTKLRS
ncbi:MAG TPA: hypothetical protein PKH39_15075, partial [Woeseiaceae bacterium]|nr:hypothetical protein [Woeseiaceae bacterium]